MNSTFFFPHRTSNSDSIKGVWDNLGNNGKESIWKDIPTSTYRVMLKVGGKNNKKGDRGGNVKGQKISLLKCCQKERVKLYRRRATTNDASSQEQCADRGVGKKKI